MLKRIITIGIWAFLLFGSSVAADEYKVGPGDILEISFWQDPTLNTSVRVSQEGKISLDIVGEIDAFGKTTRELEMEIVRRISRLNQKISQAVVRVEEYNYQYVFVSGQVNHPGKFTFEIIPDLWTIINEAGGITESGDLTRVTIIRGGKNAGKVEVINVSQAIATGTLDKLPKVYREDTIEIPRTLAGLPSAELGHGGEKKNVVYVVGAVGVPGPITFENNIDVMEAIGLAGGYNVEADLGKTRVLTKDGYYGQTIQLDLERYAKYGVPSRYTLKKEDIVMVPYKRSSLISKIFNVTTITALTGIVSTTLLIMNQINNDDNNQTTTTTR